MVSKMQVSVEQTGSLGRKLTVQVPSSEVEGKITDRLKELGKGLKMKGFRPGRVPFSVVRKRFGAQVRQEVVGEMIQNTFSEAVNQENLRPAGMPQIDTEPPQADADLQYTAAFDVFPEIENLDVSSIEIERPVAEVAETDIDDMIETLRQQRQSWVDVERKAAEEDLIYFHFSVDADGERFPAEGEERAGTILGRGLLGESFEKGLAGLKAGEDGQFEAEFPEEFRNKEIAGKSGNVSVKIEKVQEASLPEVDDAFAEAFGVEGGVEQLREGVKDNLERELKQGISRTVRESTLEKLRSSFADIEIPQSLIDSEIQGLQAQAQQRAAQMGQQNAPVPAAELFTDAARQRVHSALLVTEIARHAELKLDENRVHEAIAEVASTYEDPQAVMNLYYTDQRLLSPIQNLILEEQAVDWVLENANVQDQPSSFADVMKQDSDDA